MGTDQQDNEFSVQIEREKTKRTYAHVGVFGVLGLVAIILFYFNVQKGSLKVTPDGIEVSVDQPLVDQVHTAQQTIAVDGDSVAMTVGSVPDSVVQQIEQQQDSPLPSDRFVGRNLIDRSGGYVLSSATPSSWTVTEASTNAAETSLVNLRTAAGSQIHVDTMPTTRCADLECVIQSVVKGASGAPRVTRDDRTSTAVVQFKDETGRTTIVKIVRQNGLWYTVSGSVASGAQIAERKDVIKTVTTFSLIAKK